MRRSKRVLYDTIVISLTLYHTLFNCLVNVLEEPKHIITYTNIIFPVNKIM